MWHKELVNLDIHGKPISIMIFAAMWKGGRSRLVFMERDEDARNNGYSAVSYIKALEADDSLMDNYEPGMAFQQDNAPIHTAIRTRQWFEGHGIWVIEWPPHSPDLNPIEHVWAALKKKLYSLFPDLHDLQKNETDIEDLKRKIQVAWDALDQGLFDRLMDSIPRRLDAVICAKGWYTKY